MPRNMPDSEDDFIRMQHEAIRRVRDMQERAHRTLENAGVPIERPDNTSPPVMEPVISAPPENDDNRARQSAPQPASFAPPPPQAQTAPPSGRVSAHETHPPQSRPAAAIPKSNSILSGLIPALIGNSPSFNLSLDSEQIMLLLLCYLMFQDGADTFLILALGFVLIR